MQEIRIGILSKVTCTSFRTREQTFRTCAILVIGRFELQERCRKKIHYVRSATEETTGNHLSLMLGTLCVAFSGHRYHSEGTRVFLNHSPRHLLLLQRNNQIHNKSDKG